MNIIDPPALGAAPIDIDLLTVAVRPRLGGMTGWFEQIAQGLAGRGWRVRLIAIADEVESSGDAAYEVVHLPVPAPSQGPFSAFDKWTRWKGVRGEWARMKLSTPRLRISDGTPGVLDFARRLSDLDGLPWIVLMGGDVFAETRALPFAPMLHRKIRTALLRADWILVDGRDLVESLAKQGIPEDRIRIQFRGIDPLDESSPPTSSKSDSIWFPERTEDADFRMVWHGRVSEYHGPERFLEVAARIPEAIGRMAGGGAPSETFIQALETPRFSDWFLGRLGNEELFQLLREADCGVYPLRGMAGVPTVLLESMAAGLPTVTLATGSCDRLIRNGIDGLIARDIGEMAEIVDRLRSDPGLREEMGRRALETIRKDWSVDATLDRLESHLGECIGR